MPKPWIFYCENEEKFWRTALEDVIARIEKTLRTFPDCRLGLAGGSTPKILYRRLASQNLPWEKIKIIQLDERYVPSDHGESNLNMLRESLLNHAPIPPENLITFDTSLPYQSVAEEMDRRLSHLENPSRPLLDLLVLGVGKDGHIASLFEEDSALTNKGYATVATAKNYSTPQRLTLTLKALQEASSALLLIKDYEKLPVIQALEGKTNTLPLTALHQLSAHLPIKVLAYLQEPEK